MTQYKATETGHYGNNRQTTLTIYTNRGGKLNQMIWTWSKCMSKWFVWLTIQRIQLDPVRSRASVRGPPDTELIVADVVRFQVGHVEVDCTDREREMIFLFSSIFSAVFGIAGIYFFVFGNHFILLGGCKWIVFFFLVHHHAIKDHQKLP